MTPGRSFQWTAGSFGIATLAGIAALVWAQFRAVFQVPEGVADQAYFDWCTSGGIVDPAAGDRYLAMLGDHYLWTDLGAGLMATGLTGLILTVAAYGKAVDELWALTPTRRGHFLAAGWVIIGWAWFVTGYSLYADLDRQLFPWCADSIGIPLGGLFFLTITLLIACTVIGMLLLTGFGSLPVPLGQWDRARPTRYWIVTIACAVLILFVGWMMAASAHGSASIGNPAGLIAIYLLASTRAALLAPTIEVE